MKKFYILALVAMIFAACTTDETQDVQLADAPESLTVGFEGGGDNTRVQLNSAGKTVWTKDDLVSVFYRSDANQKWQFQGETGERVGNLKRVSAGSATETMKRVVVVYPYNENYYINTETYNVEATLPATQTYLKDSYGLDGNLMVSSDEFNQISLKSVYGWLKLQLTGEGEKVTSITLHGNNNEQVAGLVYINSSNAAMTLAAEMGSADDPEVGGAGGNLVFDDTIQTEVALNCGNGVELGAEATAFYIALPPQTFEKGLTVEITTEGKIMTKSTEKSLTIERNTIQPMAVFKVEIENPDTPDTPTLPTPANNEIYYTNGSFTKATIPTKTNVFGANIVSNLYDAEKECWVITFDGDVTKIGDSAFSGYDNGYSTDCRKITSITISNSVASIGESAFYCCTSLTSVTIGDSVTSIGDYAFSGCPSLTSVTIPDSVTSIGEGAFSGCYSLTAFYGKFASEDNRCLIVNGTLNSFAIGCGATSYTIPDSVTSIGMWAFYNCDSLTSVTIPDSVTSIGDAAFYNCTSLTNVTIPDSVTSIGNNAFWNCTTLTSVTIGNGVTEIGREAFYYCTSLTNVTIPDSVTSIGYWAFFGCDSLTSVTIGNGVTSIGENAFDGCKSLTSVTIPDSVTSIESGAFRDCTSLKEVYCKATTPPTGGYLMFSYYDGNGSYLPIGCKIYVPASADDSIINDYKAKQYWSDYKSNIYEYNFIPNNEIWYTNGSTTEATAPNKTDVFGANIVSNLYDAKKECWVIKFDGDVTMIGERAFYNCESLTNVTIPDSVTSIGNSAFSYCESLTNITIPDSVTSIGSGAFSSCSSLTAFYGKFASEDNRCLIINGTLNSFAPAGITSYTIPDSITEIRSYAFYGCHSLTSITIPDSVTSIGNSAFSDCPSLTAFYGKFASGDNRCLIIDGVLNVFAPAGVTSYAIPDSITSIEKNAFRNCTSLISVTIPDSVTTIRSYAFYCCTSLTSITIPDSVTSIGEDAFFYCTSLTSINIPDSVTSIGSYAFEGCTSLKEVYCKPTTPPTGGRNMFSYYDGGYKPIGCKIYVPTSDDDSIINDYKAKQYWSSYASYIEEYDFSAGQ